MSDTHTLKEVLHPYLNQALASYETFLAKEDWSDAKEFNAYHSACKAVLGHIALLMKLTQESEINISNPEMDNWLKKAKTASEKMEDFNDDFD